MLTAIFLVDLNAENPFSPESQMLISLLEVKPNQNGTV
jgi:hypothetical protein